MMGEQSSAGVESLATVGISPLSQQRPASNLTEMGPEAR